MPIDFGRTAADYGRHRAGFPDRFFARLLAAGWVAAGDRVLDLGTGTGTLARGLARRGCRVTGLDRAAALIDEARRLDREAGVEVEYVEASAEATGLPERGFDAVTAGQCWHWLDRSRAAAEARRVLRPGGRLIIAHFDWLPLGGTVVEATEALILAFSPHWRGAGGNGLYPQWFADLTAAGYRDIESFSFDLAVPYAPEAWRGRIRASAGVGASLPPAEVERFDARHARMLEERFPQDPLLVPHRVFAVTGTA